MNHFAKLPSQWLRFARATVLGRFRIKCEHPSQPIWDIKDSERRNKVVSCDRTGFLKGPLALGALSGLVGYALKFSTYRLLVCANLIAWGLFWPAVLLCFGSRAQAASDLIIYGAKISTMNPSQPEVTALAVNNGQISALGSDQEVMKERDSHTKMIKAAGRRITPGLIESHAHMVSYGLTLMRLNFHGMSSKASILAMIREQTQHTTKGQWITGRGWDQNLWDLKEFPSKDDLDRVAPDHPVALTRVDGHAAWVNSAALKLVGLDQNSKDPQGGRLLRTASGSLQGILVDQAMDLVYKDLPEPSFETKQRALKKALQDAASLGITTTTEAGASEQTIKLLTQLLIQKQLPIRINVMLAGSDHDLIERYLPQGPLNIENRMFIRSIKLFADGALGSRGAALLADYTDEPGHKGLLILSEDDIFKISRKALHHGYQIATHAIGDQANRTVLDGYQHAFADAKVNGVDQRFRIEHAQIIATEDIPRFGRLGVIASMQGSHCTSDSPWVPERLGASRAASEAYVWQGLRQSGALVVGGSDAPVESLNPLWGLFSFVTRQTQKGQPPFGWQPDQRLTRQQALASYTKDGAYAAYLEDLVGTLEVGKQADLVMYQSDIMTIAAQDLPHAKVDLTMVGGSIVYSRKDPLPSH